MDEITPLSGVQDTDVYEEGHKPLGTEISADVLALINKQLEVVTGLNEISVRADQADSDVDDLEAWETLITPVIGSVADCFETTEHELSSGDQVALTTAQCNTYARIMIREGCTGVTLPDGMMADITANSWSPHGITIINGDDSAVVIQVATTEWADGSAGATYEISLDQGECVVVYPGLDVSDDEVWYLVSGQTTLTAP